MRLLTTIGVSLYGAATIMTTGNLFIGNQASLTAAQSSDNKVVEVAAVQPDSPAPTAPQPTLVTVNEGDSLASIADANASTYIRLFQANTAITNPDLIYPGQVLRIPSTDEQLTPRELPVYIASAPVETTSTKSTNVTTQVKTPARATPVVSSSGNGVWDQIAACESGGNWSINTGNGFYGGLQFTLASWQAVGGTGYPNQASPSEQIARAVILQSRQGWGAWPACSAKLGLR